MTPPEDFQDLIGRWPSPNHFARAVAGDDAGDHGKIWKRRNRVPTRFHARIVEICERKKIPGVTLEFLAALRKRGRGVGY